MPPDAVEATQLFLPDDVLAARLRKVAGELRIISSRRRAFELASEVEAVAAVLDPPGAAA